MSVNLNEVKRAIVEETPKKIGRIRKGWELTKSSWQVLVLDKELISLPLIGMMLSLLTIGVFGLLYILCVIRIHTGGFNPVGANFEFSSSDVPIWLNLIFFLTIYFVMSFIANVIAAAVIFGANERFCGGDPTVRGSVAGAFCKLKPLAAYTLMMSVIGVILKTIEERVPFAANIAVQVFGGLWSVANVFAIPVITLSEGSVSPFDATKESVGIIRRIWGESVVADLGVSIIEVLAICAYIALWTLLSFIAIPLSLSLSMTIALGTSAFLGLIGVSLIFSTLSSILKAALYRFATTGTAPLTFSHNMLNATVNPKKSRRILGF